MSESDKIVAFIERLRKRGPRDPKRQSKADRLQTARRKNFGFYRLEDFNGEKPGDHPKFIRHKKTGLPRPAEQQVWIELDTDFAFRIQSVSSNRLGLCYALAHFGHTQIERRVSAEMLWNDFHIWEDAVEIRRCFVRFLMAYPKNGGGQELGLDPQTLLLYLGLDRNGTRID